MAATVTPQQLVKAGTQFPFAGNADSVSRPLLQGSVLNPYAFLVDISERAHTREMAITNVLATAGIGMWSYSVYSKKFHLCPVASGFFGDEKQQHIWPGCFVAEIGRMEAETRIGDRQSCLCYPTGV